MGSAWGMLLMRLDLLLFFGSDTHASASLTMGSTDLWGLLLIFPIEHILVSLTLYCRHA